jgi:hypothetical protein
MKYRCNNMNKMMSGMMANNWGDSDVENINGADSWDKMWNRVRAILYPYLLTLAH